MASKPKRFCQNKRKQVEKIDTKPIPNKRKRVLARKLRDSSLDIVTTELPENVEPIPPKVKREKKTPTVKKSTPKKPAVATSNNNKVNKKITKKNPVKKTVKKKISKPIKYDRIAPLESINEVALMQSAKKNAKKYLFNKKSLLERMEETKKQVIKVKLPKSKIKKKIPILDQNTSIAELIENNLQEVNMSDEKNPENYIIIKVPVGAVNQQPTVKKAKLPKTPKKVKQVTKPRKAVAKTKKVAAKAKTVVVNNSQLRKLRSGSLKKPDNEEIISEGAKIESPKKVEISNFEQKFIRRLSLSSVSCRNSELSDALSWTKVMSSTSKSCSPVSINDIVKIDGKIPLVTVLKDEMLPILNKNIGSPSYSDIIQNNSLNLSSATSSTCLDTVTTCESSYSLFSTLGLAKCNEVNKPMDEKLVENLKLIKSKVNSFDVEFVTWSMRDYEDKPIRKEKWADIIVKALKHELDLLEKCKQMRPLTNSFNKNTEDKESSIQSSEVIPHEPIIETVIPVHKENVDIFVKPLPVTEKTHRKSSVHLENTINPTVNGNDLTDTNDDDCLSICDSADSFWNNCDISEPAPKQSEFDHINDMELSDSETGDISSVDEPQNKAVQKNVVQNECLTDKIPIVCEKQTADTTFADDKIANTEAIVVKEIVGIPNKDTNANVNNNPMKLVTSNFVPINIVNSEVFFGLCIFYLIGNCKKYNCRYSHKRPIPEQLIPKLEKMGNFAFIQEYLLVRDRNGLINYLPMFVKDCLRRKLWDLLAEMAIDTYKYSSLLDANLSLCVLEQILLGFKDCDLNSVNLLDYNLQDGYLLCDMFLQRIAQSSNFTQFKEVFIKLSDYYEKTERNISLKVTIPIIERVCLIAYNKKVVEATLKIILNTNHSILSSEYMETYERLLDVSLLDSNLLNKWKEFKKQSSKVENNDVTETAKTNDVPRYTSPDTTHLENANKLESALCAKMDTLKPFNVVKHTTAPPPIDVFTKPAELTQTSPFMRSALLPSCQPLDRWYPIGRQRYDNKGPWQRRNYKTIKRIPNFKPHRSPNYFKP